MSPSWGICLGSGDPELAENIISVGQGQDPMSSSDLNRSTRMSGYSE